MDIHRAGIVLLTGCFNLDFFNGSSWTDHIPMSPMEGCPTVFQVIHSLMPGYHQVNMLRSGSHNFICSILTVIRICQAWRDINFISLHA